MKKVEKLAMLLYDKWIIRIINLEKESGELRKLKVMTEDVARQHVRMEYVAMLQKMIMIIIGIFLFAILVLYSCCNQTKEKEIRLARQNQDGEGTTYELFLKQEEEDIAFLIDVEPQQYTAEAMEQMFQDGFAYINKHLLGENESYEQISKPLELVREIPNLPLKVNYWWEAQDIILEDGEIDSSKVSEPMPIYIQVTISYEEEKRAETVALIVVPPQYTEQEKAIQKVQRAIASIDQTSLEAEELVIPTDIEGEEIYQPKSEEGLKLLFLLFVLPVLLFAKIKQDRREHLKKREDQLLSQYPEMVNQLVLYLGAGMTTKGCFMQMAKEYQRQKEKSYLYEECCAMVQELNTGVSEKYCYEALGKQLELPIYRKLMTLLCQNLSKGSKEILLLLQQEVDNSFEFQRDYARKKGEEASTKLLFPMLLLLVVVMIIVMVPAFLGFSVGA